MKATTDDRFKLLAGPYKSPPLKRGDRATCLYRDCDVAIISLTDARIPWPRCRPVGAKAGGGGLLVDEELARAVRTESSAAIQHWWGVSEGTVWLWRKTLGIGQWGTEGSARLHRRSSEAGASRLRGKKLPRALVRRREAARRAKGFTIPNRWEEDGWKPEQLALLGTLPDEAVAKKIGRTVAAVTQRRNLLGIPTAKDRRRKR